MSERDPLLLVHPWSDADMATAGATIATLRASLDETLAAHGKTYLDLRAMTRERDEWKARYEVAIDAHPEGALLARMHDAERERGRAQRAGRKRADGEANAIGLVDKLRADFARIATALGCVHDQSMGPSYSGTVEDVLRTIAGLKAENEQLMEDREYACESPPEGCQCCGCLAASDRADREIAAEADRG